LELKDEKEQRQGQLHDEELHTSYTPPMLLGWLNQAIKMGEECSMHGEADV
jgi:hypothetical protein